MKNNRQCLAASAAVTALAASSPFSVMAQSTSERILEEVIVTVTRRESELQTTAASVSAYSEEDLVIRSLVNIEDVGLIDPSAQVALYQGEAQVFLRGVGTPITVGGTDSATAIYRDGEFLSRAAASVPGFFDVASVQILKGPQGTLWGRNATAGSVLVTSQQPTEELSGYVTATAGNYDRIDVSGAISGPIVQDKLLYRVAAQTRDRDGFTTSRNLNDPSRPSSIGLEDRDEIFFRGVLEWRPSDSLTISWSGDYYKADDRANTFFLTDNSFGYAQPPFNPAGPAINTFGVPAGNFGINNFSLLGQSAGNISQVATRENQHSNERPFNRPEIWGSSVRFIWDVGEYEVKSSSAYRETKPENFVDFDLSDSTVGRQTQYRAEDQWQFTQEIQISSPADRRFQWVAGGSVFIEENFIQNEYLIASLPALFDFAVDAGIFPESINGAPIRLPDDGSCCVFELNGELETEAVSVFLDTTYDFSDKLTLGVGGRYSTEDRSGRNLLATELELGNPILAGPPFSNVAEFPETTFDAFTPKIGLEYQASDDVFVYGTITRGFKSGGFNIGSLQNEPFDQELTWAYELGWRSDLLNGLLRLNGTLFFYDVTDLQVQTVVNNSIVVNNAAGAEVSGIEFDGTISVTDNLSIDFAMTYLETEITEVEVDAAIDPTRLSFPSDPTLASELSGDGAVPATGAFNIVENDLPKAPEMQFNVGVNYVLPFSTGADLTFRGDWSFQDQIFFNQFNDTGFSDLPVSPVIEQSFHWLRARVAYTSPSQTWRMSVFADNIGDEEVITNAVYNGAVSGQFGLGSLAPPRTYGAEIRYSF